MKLFIALWGLIVCVSTGMAEVRLPNVFSDHMVLQRNHENPVWGKADPGEKVTVEFAGQKKSAVANGRGDWRVLLAPLEASFEPGTMKIYSSGNLQTEIGHILVGEVWMVSGQSNMAWVLHSSNHADLELASANYPNIRLFRIPMVGAAEKQFNVDAAWVPVAPDTVGGFSATAYLFGRRLYNTLQVPIGLINHSWGGSPIEAFIPRTALDEAGEYTEMLKKWDERYASYTDETLAKEIAEFEAWEKAGRPAPKRWRPTDIRTGRHRPANIYNAMVHPVQGYGIKGTIWCQGESNLGNPYQYRSLFPLLINTWRELWDQGDFPFYWVQLADYSDEQLEPGKSNWAELREAQTMTLSLPNTGEAVVIDTGEARDIHPRDKQTAANRLVRHALANDYGYKMPCKSPVFQSLDIEGNVATVTFDHVSSHLYAFDVPEVKGFALAGADGKFYWAEAKIVGKNKVEITSDNVDEPVAVRYGWANNPVVNLYDRIGLPVTPFRTDKD